MNNIINYNLKFSDLLGFYLEFKFKYFFIINDEKKLVGAISQSDIIISLLESVDTSMRVKSIMNPNPLFMYDFEEKSSGHEKVKKFLIQGITEYPILNSKNEIVKIASVYNHFIND